MLTSSPRSTPDPPGERMLSRRGLRWSVDGEVEVALHRRGQHALLAELVDERDLLGGQAVLARRGLGVGHDRAAEGRVGDAALHELADLAVVAGHVLPPLLVDGEAEVALDRGGQDALV